MTASDLRALIAANDWHLDWFAVPAMGKGYGEYVLSARGYRALCHSFAYTSKSAAMKDLCRKIAAIREAK